MSLRLALAAALVSTGALAQTDTALNDSLPEATELKPVTIFSYKGLSASEITAFRTLLFRINKLYPFYLEALRLMKEADEELASLDKKRQQNKYKKQTENELRDEYKEQLKNFTVSETETFIKMIERATGMTLFEIIKKYKGGSAAAWWQSIAKLAGVDLKEGYDPQKIKYMEFIMKTIEAGETLPTK